MKRQQMKDKYIKESEIVHILAMIVDRNLAQKIVDNISTDNVVEVKHGRWEYKERRAPLYDLIGVKTWGVAWQCSECGFIHTCIENRGRYVVCPNCGAKMDEVEE